MVQMKEFFIIVLVASIFYYHELYWDLYETTYSFCTSVYTGTYRIPQFIRDTRHCWLDDNNKTWLGWLKDTKGALCSLDSDIRPGNGGPRTYPADLYKRLEINNNRYGINRRGWGNAVARLKEMLDCPAALQDVEVFEVEIYISDGAYGIGIPESPTPPDDLPGLFVEVLTSMPNLRILDWNTHDNANDVFRDAFLKANLTLPTVRHLRLARFTQWLTGMCPNVEILETGGGSTSRYWRGNPRNIDPKMSLILSAFDATNLTTFGINGEWELAYLDAMLDVMPNITSLNIDGQLPDRYYYEEDEAYYGKTLKSFMAALSHFPQLKHLRVPYAGNLGLSYDGGPRCGNVYLGPHGMANRRQDARRAAEATEDAAEIILPVLPRLESLSIGGRRVNWTRDENGTLNITWPWTGRMDEYLWEKWPDRATPDGSWREPVTPKWWWFWRW